MQDTHTYQRNTASTHMVAIGIRIIVPSTPSSIPANSEQGCWRDLEEGNGRGEAVQRVDGRALLVHRLVFGVGPDKAVQVAALKLVRLLRDAQPAYSGCVPDDA